MTFIYIHILIGLTWTVLLLGLFEKVKPWNLWLCLYLCSRCCCSCSREAQCWRKRKGKEKPRPGWRCSDIHSKMQPTAVHSPNLRVVTSIFLWDVSWKTACHYKDEERERKHLTCKKWLRRPLARRHILFQHVTPLSRLNCPKDVSAKKSGIPEVTRKTTYGIRKTPSRRYSVSQWFTGELHCLFTATYLPPPLLKHR